MGLSIGIVTNRSRCQREAPSISAASVTSVGTPWSAARNINMNVPAVVQIASAMIAIMATLGPESHSHQLRPKNVLPVSASGGAVVSQIPIRPPMRWSVAARIGEPDRPVDAEEAQHRVHRSATGEQEEEDQADRDRARDRREVERRAEEATGLELLVEEQR